MWLPLQDNDVGVVIWPFNGATVVPSPYGLDLSLGNRIITLAEHSSGWLVGISEASNQYCIIPSSFVFRKSACDAASEVTSAVREWGELWKKLYTDGHEYQEQVIRSGILELIEGRRLLLNGNLTREQYEEVQLKLTSKIDWGNRKLGLDLVPRDGCAVINGGTDTCVVKLFHYHLKSTENSEAARNTLKKRKVRSFQDASGGQHLVMTVRDFTCSISEDFEIYFSLFDGSKNSHVSERYATMLPASNSVFIDRIQTISTVFTDLCNGDVNSDLFLVTQIVRVGRMFFNDGLTKKSAQNYRRPFASGVLNLGECVLNNENNLSQENEYSFRLYSCDEKEFWQVPELIIKGSSKITPMNFTITVSMRLYRGDIKNVREENQVLFRNIVSTDKIGFPDVIMPGVVRNDLYVTLLHGEFEKTGKTMGGRNISVSILALDSSGKTIEGGVWGAVDACSYESFILYHNNNPKWNETIKIKIPIEKFPDAHLRFEFRHCSTKEKNERKLFGISFMSLMDSNGAVVKDSTHTLPIYKCEDSYFPANYLSPSLAAQKSVKEFVTIRTQLVSTKLTQNADLVALLKWKSQPEKVKQTLASVLELPGEEIVKFLQDVLDVLFAMFVSEEGSSTEHSEDAFLVLLHIFSLLEDSKFKHFRPVIDAYIDDHFAAALVYKGILSTITHYASVVPLLDKERMTKVRNCFKTAEYIFKFTVQSQILFSRATGGHMNDSFRRDIVEMFRAFNSLLAFESTAAEVVSTQSSLLLGLKQIYTNLIKILPTKTVTDLVLQLFQNVPLFPSAHPLSPSKLRAFCDVVGCEVFHQEAFRPVVMPEMCKHIRHHLTIRDELKLTSDILLAILESLNESPDTNTSDIQIVATHVLEPLVNSVLILERSSSVITPLVVTLIALYQQMTSSIYNRVFDELKDLPQIRSFILRTFYVFRDLIKFDVFNDDWFKMKLLVNCNILKALVSYSGILAKYFLKQNYDPDLYLEYFSVCFSFILQDCLQLENFRENKRSWVLKEYGDMRLRMVHQVINVWSSTDEKVHYAPSLVSQILLVSLLPVQELSVSILPLLVDLTDAQFQTCGNFRLVEAEIIDKLDTYVMENRGDENYIRVFHSILSTKVETMRPRWIQAGLTLIDSIKSLLEILMDYRTIPNDVENKDKKMNCINNLLNFYETVDLKQMYIKYVYKLHDLHVSSGNYSEAGFALLLHAEMLDFMKEYETKEQLYLQVIKYFDEGKLWEHGIPLCKDLANIYERNFEYKKLSNILVTTSAYFNNILTQHRAEPEYFRVSFIGLGFPLFVRNKEFIYRGLEYERLTSFVQRIVAEWPGAEVLKTSGNDSSSLVSSERQYLWIRSVKPLPCYPPGFHDAPIRIKSYYKWNNINKFQYDHVLSKNLDDVSSMWIERTILETASSFPGMLRFFVVKSKVTEVLSPVKFAVEKVMEVNQNLEEILSTYSDSENVNINVNPLSMRLQGMLDANVQGGLPKYQEAFFSPEFLVNSPEATEDVCNLSRAIQHEIEILEKALAVHSSIMPPGVQPLHSRLVECFKIMSSNFQGMNVPPLLKRSESLKACSSIVNTPLPPLPTYDNRLECTSSTPCPSKYGYGRQNSRSSEDENFYSLPAAAQPPPVPDRKKKSNSFGQSQDQNDKVIVSSAVVTDKPREGSKQYHLKTSVSLSSSSDYIVIPPSQIRESGNISTPPRPPKHDSHLNGASTPPPPVPPKPSPNRDSLGTSSRGDRSSCNSNSSASSSSYKEFYVLPPKRGPHTN